MSTAPPAAAGQTMQAGSDRVGGRPDGFLPRARWLFYLPGRLAYVMQTAGSQQRIPLVFAELVAIGAMAMAM